MSIPQDVRNVTYYDKSNNCWYYDGKFSVLPTLRVQKKLRPKYITRVK